jgi:hypothetical protein
MTTIETTMSYLEPWNSRNEEPYLRGKIEDSFPRTNFTNQEFPVQVHDARPNKVDFTLDTHGFTFCEDEGIDTMTVEAIRQRDTIFVTEKYYPIVEALLKKELGASRIVIFDHTYRRKNPTLSPSENPNGGEQPATLVRHSSCAFGRSSY